MGLFDDLFGSKPQTVTQNNSIPLWLSQAAQSNFNAAAQIAAQPYRPYNAPRVAPMTADQKRAFDLTRQTATAANPMFNQAAGLASAAAKPISGNYGVTAQKVTPTTVQAATTGVRQQAMPASVKAQGTGVRQQAMPANVKARGTAVRQQAMPANVKAQSISSPTIGVRQQALAGDVRAQNVSATNTGIRQMATPADIAAQNVKAGTTGIRQQTMPGNVSAQQVGTQSFLNADIGRYMNPFLDEVLNRSLQDVRREGEIARNQIEAQRAMSGAFGDARHGVLEGEQRGNELDTAADLSARLRAQGYDAGVAAFEGDRMARMQADLSNQAAALQAAQGNQAVQESVGGRNLQAMLGVDFANADRQLQAALANQGAGLQAGMANQQNRRDVGMANLQAGIGIDRANADRMLEAARLNQGANLQAGLANQQMRESIGGRNLMAALGVDETNAANRMQALLSNQRTGLEAALANQSTQANVGGRNLEAALGVDRANADRYLQAALANQATQANVGGRNLEAALGVDRANADRYLQAALANQQMQGQVGANNLEALLGIDRDNAARTMQARQLNQAAQLQAGQLNQGAALDAARFTQQLRAQMGMADRERQLQSAGMLGDLGMMRSQTGYQGAAALAGIGEAQQALNQRSLDTRYEDFLRQLQYPAQQLNIRTAALSGVPYSTASQSVMPGPNQTAQTLGGVAALAGALGGSGGVRSLFDWL